MQKNEFKCAIASMPLLQNILIMAAFRKSNPGGEA